ncbi:MAG: hypothetical protein LBH76_05140, partial [Propionibacteriaceae bacterium]|nr:hypothetical protein [Propionibacteriaceae bacterium]
VKATTSSDGVLAVRAPGAYFRPGQSFECTGYVSKLGPNQTHADTVKVTGKGVQTWQAGDEPTTATDPWHGRTLGPELELTKWVCATGANCAEPTADDIAVLREAAQTKDGKRAVTAAAAHGWVDAAQVAYNGTAQWLLLAVNTGDTKLGDLILTREDFNATDAAGFGATTSGTAEEQCRAGHNLGVLDKGAAKTLICYTSAITEQAPLYLGHDVVNTAAGSATPVNPDGSRINVTGGGALAAVPSNQGATDPYKGQAHVDAVAPTRAITIEKYSDTFPAGDHDNAPGKLLAPGEPADLTFMITNPGDETLVNVRVTDKPTVGDVQLADFRCVFPDGTNGRAWSNPEDPTDTGLWWDGPFTGRGSFTCTGKLPGLAAGAVHADLATVTANGTLTPGTGGSTEVTSNDPWNAQAPDPALGLTKWVCDGAAGCGVPTGEVLANLAAGTPDGGWVSRTAVPYAADAQWLLVVSNQGNTELAAVTLVREDLGAGATEKAGVTEKDGSAAVYAVTGDQCAVGANLGDLRPKGLGAPIAIPCTTAQILATGGFGTGGDVVNTAQAEGWPVDGQGQPLPGWDPQTDKPVPSPEAAAEARTDAPQAELALTKWVCDPAAGQGCEDPDQTLTAEQLQQLVDGHSAGGWAPQATVPYGTAADWLLVVHNPSYVALTEVAVAGEQVTDAGSQIPPPADCLIGAKFGDGKLGPGDTATLRCTTGQITNTAPLDGKTDVVNTATAGGLPVDGEGNPWPGVEPIETPEASAEVNTLHLQPQLDLTKWVCKAGAGCTTPTLATRTALLKDPADGAGGWVKATTVDYNTPAQWLLLVANTGDTRLVGVTLTKEDLDAGGAGHGATSGCRVGDRLGDLGVGDSMVVICQTAGVVNQAELGSGQEVVNTAAAKATPADGAGQPLVADGKPLPDVESEPDTASVNAKPSKPAIDVEKYDTLNGDDVLTGDHDDADAPKVLQPGKATDLTIKVRNTGGEDLVDIKVADGQWSNPEAAGSFGLSCDFSALGGPSEGTEWAGPFAPGAEFDCSGTVPGMAAGESHSDTATVDAKTQWGGQPVTDDDEWHGWVPKAELGLNKWVCGQADGC